MSNTLPAEIRLKEKSASTDSEKADLFADYFRSVYTQYESDTEISNFINNRDDSECYNIEITEATIRRILNSMDLNKGSGFDGVSSLYLRKCSEELCGPLSEVFLKSLKDKTYPSLFKTGQLTPIYKSGKRTDVENYRGACVLPNLAKVFERAVYIQLRLILTSRISRTQHAFLSNRNIETNLMELTTLIHQAFDKNVQLDVFYSDIGKAFDKVNPCKFIRKMAEFPLSNMILMWLISYLESRMQYVKVGAAKSKLFEVLSGIGQGTILGPLFFLIFFNGSDGITVEIHHLNFADDKKIAAIVETRDDAVRLQEAINSFLAWCSDNDLSVNLTKCKVITFTLKRHPIKYEYTIEDEVIQRVEEIKDLAVILDSKLSMNAHNEYICNKSKSSLQFVRRQSHIFSTDITKILYNSLCRSSLEFASTVWSPYHQNQKDNIESTQKQFLIFLNGDDRTREENNFILRPYMERCKEAQIQTLERRRVNAAALFIHAIITGRFRSPHLRNQIKLNTGHRNLRKNNFIQLNWHRTKHSAQSPFNNACKIFNQAAAVIEPMLTRNQFKTQLMKLPDETFGLRMR